MPSGLRLLGASLGGWSGLGSSRALAIVVDFAVTAYLMRVLGPNPFGLVAMADGVLLIVGAVGDAGVGASLVSDRERGPRRIGAAYMLALLIGSVLAILLILATPLVAALYGTDAVFTPWLVLSGFFALALIPSVSFSLLQVRQRFALIGIIQLSVALLAGATAIVIASSRQDVWPILARRMVIVVGPLVLLTIAARPKIGLPRPMDLRAIGRFSAGVTGFNVLNALNRNADNVLIGRFLGEGPLGLYALAYKILLFPLGQLGGLVGTVAYPHLASRLPDLRKVAVDLANVMAGLASFVTPLGLGVALAAPELVDVVFGPEWAGAVTPLRILALLSIYQVPYAQSGYAYTVSRRTGLMTRWALIATPVLVGSFVIGLRWGIVGVAGCYALASLALAPALVGMAAAALGCPRRTLAGPVVRAVAGGFASSIPMLVAWFVLRTVGAGPIAVLVGTITGGLIAELMGVRSLWRLYRQGSLAQPPSSQTT
jgi:PST family polysaccharide transporter